MVSAILRRFDGLSLDAWVGGLPLDAGLGGLPLDAGVGGLPLDAGVGIGCGFWCAAIRTDFGGLSHRRLRCPVLDQDWSSMYTEN